MLGAILMLLAGLVGLVVLLPMVAFGCSSPSDAELRAQEAFVRTHVSDARDFESGVLDCDDHGDGFVTFTTDLSPTAAGNALLRDAACRATPEDDGGAASLTCAYGDIEVRVFFEHNDSGGTDGQLILGD